MVGETVSAAHATELIQRLFASEWRGNWQTIHFSSRLSYMIQNIFARGLTTTWYQKPDFLAFNVQKLLRKLPEMQRPFWMERKRVTA